MNYCASRPFFLFNVQSPTTRNLYKAYSGVCRLVKMAIQRPKDNDLSGYRLFREKVGTGELKSVIDDALLAARSCDSDRTLEHVAFHFDTTNALNIFDVYMVVRYGPPYQNTIKLFLTLIILNKLIFYFYYLNFNERSLVRGFSMDRSIIWNTLWPLYGSEGTLWPKP